MIYPHMMDHFKTWLETTVLADDPNSTALDFIPPQRIPGPACCGCGAADSHDETIPLFEGQVLPPTWPGTWTRAAVCAACAARQQALRYPVTLMVFRHMRYP